MDRFLSQRQPIQKCLKLLRQTNRLDRQTYRRIDKLLRYGRPDAEGFLMMPTWAWPTMELVYLLQQQPPTNSLH